VTWLSTFTPEQLVNAYAQATGVGVVVGAVICAFLAWRF